MAEARIGEIGGGEKVDDHDLKASKFKEEQNRNHQWRLTTEAMRRDCLTKPEVRDALLPFCTQRVTETLPKDLVDSVSAVDDRVGNLAKRYETSLLAYLNLPAVPEDQIKPDITYSRIPRDKKTIALERYAWARDVKLLALGAEIVEQGNKITPDANGEVTLPSGIKLFIDTKQDDQKLDLLQPQLWEKRRQLKDRVYEIWVNGRKYILKEKKTIAHRDTKRGGHVEGASIPEEFTNAKYFNEHATTEKGNIKVSWEKPIGFATYPDGFQFAVYEFEEGLTSDPCDELTKLILRHPDQFQEEYSRVKELAENKYKNDWRTAVPKFEPWRNTDNLLFEEFSRQKAYVLEYKAIDLMKEIIARNGYTNSDLDGYAFKVFDGEKVMLELVGFDFEYYLHNFSPEEAEEEVERIAKWNKDWRSDSFLGTIEDTRMSKAARLALYETEGMIYPDNPEKFIQQKQPQEPASRFGIRQSLRKLLRR